MRKALILFALGVSTASGAYAQDVTSSSGSNSGATSGSISGSASDVSNSGNNNIGTSSSTSGSNSDATSGSISGSASYGNSSSQGQDQGQGQTQSNQLSNNINITTPNTPQTAQNAQGAAQASGTSMATSLSFHNTNRKTTEVRTNSAVPLAASSSFSSDYCGGTVSGGASVAPLGISLGGSGPKFDHSCQALRRAEKFGMAAANAHNLGQEALANQLMTMMIWSICTSDDGNQQTTAQACAQAGLMGPPRLAANQPMPSPLPPPPLPAKSPKVAENGRVTPEAATRAISQSDSTKIASLLPQ
jgi:hypothetical protein